mgnify:CR=1 FL=1
MENTVEKQYGLDVWVRFLRKISENGEIEDMAVDELNILICRFMMDKKERWRCVRANNSHFILFLPSFSGEKNENVTHRPRSVRIGRNCARGR